MTLVSKVSILFKLRRQILNKLFSKSVMFLCSVSIGAFMNISDIHAVNGGTAVTSFHKKPIANTKPKINKKSDIHAINAGTAVARPSNNKETKPKKELPNQTEADVKKFITSTSQKVIDTRKSASSKSGFAKIAKSCLAIDSICKFFLGPRYKTLSDHQKKQLTLAVINLISERLLKELPYGDSVDTDIKKVKYFSKKHWLVTVIYSVKTKRESKKYTVKFSVYNTPTGLLIFDAKTNGVSAGKIQKAEIDGEISKVGFKRFLAKFFQKWLPSQHRTGSSRQANKSLAR